MYAMRNRSFVFPFHLHIIYHLVERVSRARKWNEFKSLRSQASKPDLSHFNYIYQQDICLCTDSLVATCDLEAKKNERTAVEAMIYESMWENLQISQMWRKFMIFFAINRWFYFLVAATFLLTVIPLSILISLSLSLCTISQCKNVSQTQRNKKLIKINHVHLQYEMLAWDVLMSEPRDIKYCESYEHIL